MMKKILAALLILALSVGVLSMTATAAGTTKAASAGDYEVGYAKVDINPYWQAWQTWSKNNSAVPQDMRGAIPHSDFYDAYDLLPLPMGGYGNTETRLSRPKLMDDNGSGEGASTTNVAISDSTAYYYKKTDGTYGAVTSSNFYSRTALYTKRGNKYNKVTDYQDVHLSNNRYTEKFATELLGSAGAQAYYSQAGSSWGENDGDGVWATCVLVEDPQSDSPLLLISIDNLGVDTTLSNLIKESILAKNEIKAIGLTEDRILINSNHTHGSVALGTQYTSDDDETTYTLAEGTFEDETSITFTEKQLYWYLRFYKNHIMSQLAAAAVAAVNDRETALTMEKGTIDASLQTNKQLNGVRHNVQTYYGDPEITYVRGSSFNNDMNRDSSGDTHAGDDNFSKSEPVTTSDDSLHILKFTFANKNPIVMVNFRAHSTANNKEAAKLLHYNISADWVSPLRRELEQAGYRFSLLYGNSGNLGTGLSNGEDDVIPHDYANYNATLGRWELPATPYGRQIAQAALALLGDVTENNNAITTAMHSVTMGKIHNLKSSYVLKKQEWSPLAYAAALTFYSEGAPYYGGRYKINDGAKVTYGTASITLGKGEGGTFVVASKYHASSIKSKYETTGNISLELNAVLMGDAVAFVTSPIEASDRYFTEEITKTTDILSTASNYNDWWDLNDDTWGTPFMLSLTNGSRGYVPNQLAYDYNNDYTGTDYMVAVGSYESQTAWAARGEGENIVATLNAMLRNLEPKTAYCAHCKKDQAWYPLSTSSITAVVTTNAAGEQETSYELQQSGHYYLAGNFDFMYQVKVNAGVSLCLDLNGYTYSAKSYASASRAFDIHGTLNIQDTSESKTGKVQGYGVKWTTNTDFAAGTLYVQPTGILNLYSGSLTMNHVAGYGPCQAGVVNVAGGTFNMHGGNVYGGKADNGVANATTCNGGNIYLASGIFNMLDGHVYGGTAVNNGGNLYVAGGTANLTGGTVSGGTAADGGSIYVASGTLTLNGATVSGGSAAHGGNIYVAGGTVALQSGSVDGGSATQGGNVYIPKDAAFVLAGGSITGGTATSNGGNVFVAADGSFTMNSGNLTGGRAEKAGAQPIGGNVYTAGSFTLNGGSITGGYAYLGGNVQVQSSTASFTMTGGTISGGTAGYNTDVADLCTSTGSNFRLEGGYIAGTAYVQGYVTLADTTAGETPIRLYVKEAADRLTIEGAYTGKINLVFNKTYQSGAKIGNANNASIAAARITAEDYPEMAVAVVDNELRLAAPASNVAKIGDVYFDNFADAFDAYTVATAPVVLLTTNADLGTLPKDVTLDLNGFDVTAVITNGHTLTVLDTATADYDSPDADSYGTVPAVAGIRAAAGYMDITQGGKTSFHKYEMALTHVNVSPKDKKGISYETSFKGDQVVKEQIKEFGVAVRLYAAPNATTIWADPDCLTHVALDGDDWQTGTETESLKSVYIKNILDKNEDLETNRTRAAIPIYGRAYIQLRNGDMLLSGSANYSMQTAMELVDDYYWTDLVGENGRANLQALFEEFADVMENWDIPNISSIGITM